MSDSIANGGCCSGSVRPGTYGDASDVAQITVDKCGRITKISNVAIAGGGGSSQWTGTTGNPIYYVPNVGIGSSATPTAKLQVTGNIYASNAITTKNVFATGLYGDTGLLSNLVVSSNLYVANTFQVDNAFFANTTTVDMNFNTLTITYINTSNIVVSNLIASVGNIYMYGNVYVSNSLTSDNIFATRYYGDGGLLSNISSSSIKQPFANLAVSNSVTTTNVFAANVNVTDTFGVLGSMTANAANATFFFDTFTIPYINTQYLNVASNVTITGNLSVPSANITTLNVNYLTVNSAVVYGTNTLNVYGVSNLTTVTGTSFIGTHYGPLAGSNTVSASTQTLNGTAGQTTLNVTGNVYASNAVTTTNVLATNVTGTNVIGTLYGPLAGSNTVSASTVTGTSFIGTHYGPLAGSNTVSASTQTLNGTAGQTTLNVTGNVYVSNALATTNVLATGNVSVGDLLTVGGLAGYTSLNVTGNVYASNAVTTTNVLATSISVGDTMTIAGAAGKTSLDVTGNVYASNAVTTTNVLATSISVGDTMTIAGAAGKTSLDVTGNVYASNAVTTTNVLATNVTGTNVIGTLYGPLAGSNTVSASTVTGTSFIGTHYGPLAGSNTVSASTQTLNGTAGQTTLNVTGNVYASNAVTTTNVYLRSGVTDPAAGQIVKGAVEFNGTSNVFYGTQSTIRGLLPVQYFYQLSADATLGTTTGGVDVPSFPTIVNGVQLDNGRYYMKMFYLLSLTTSSTAGSTQLNMLLNGGSSVASMSGCGVFSYNITSTGGFGSTVTSPSFATVYFNGMNTERVSAPTTATSTLTYYYTTLEGTFIITTPGGWYPITNITSPGTFTTPLVRRGSFIYLERLGLSGSDTNIGEWS